MKKLILILALFTPPALADNSPQHSSVLGVSGGRYVFGQIGDAITSSFMLDTQTGRLWKYQLDDKGGLTLAPITYTLADGSASLTPIDTDKELAAFQRAKEAVQPSALQPSQSDTAQPASTPLPGADPALAALADAKAQTVVSLIKAGDMDGAKKIVDGIQDEALKNLVRVRVDKALKQ